MNRGILKHQTKQAFNKHNLEIKHYFVNLMDTNPKGIIFQNH